MTRGVSTKDHARLRMIHAARDLFHQQGIHATSVDQILERSETGKGQFSYYFKNKDGLIHAVLKDFYVWLRSEDFPVKYTFDSLEGLKKWFDFFIQAQKGTHCERGCPIGTIGNDLSNEQELLRQDVRLIFEYTHASLTQSLSLLKAKGELADEVDPESLADFCLTIMQGGLLLAKIKRDIAPFQHAVEHARSYLSSLNSG